MSTPRIAATISSPVAFAAAVLMAAVCVVAVAVLTAGATQPAGGGRAPHPSVAGTTAIGRPATP